jgi:hypothetical protein
LATLPPQAIQNGVQIYDETFLVDEQNGKCSIHCDSFGEEKKKNAQL